MCAGDAAWLNTRTRTRTRALVLSALCALMPVTAGAQADTIGPPIPLFTYRDAILAGSVTLGTVLIRSLDERFARRLQDSSTQANEKLRRIAAFVRVTAAPGTFVVGAAMYATGRIAKSDKLADVGLHGTEALLIGVATGAVLKGVVGRARPSVEPRNPNNYQLFRGFRLDDGYQSFPSGHTAAGFAAAAAVTSEMSRYSPNYLWLVGPVLYGGATLVGFSRMYNNRHWVSDVVMGAGIGTFAGLKIVRWHHSNPGNRIDKLLLTGSLVPLDGGGHALRWAVLPGFSPNASRR